jgi:hypothetical protein
MSDTWLTNNPVASFFFAGDNKNVPQALRQKIAMAMMMQKRAYPKNFGEGLSAIGESIGDIAMMRRLEREAADAEKVAQVARGDIAGTAVPPSAPSATPAASYAPPSSIEAEPAVQAINAATAPPEPAWGPLSTEAAPLTTTPPAEQPPATMFSPQPTMNRFMQTPPVGRFTPPTSSRPPPQAAAPPPGAIRDPNEYNEIDAQAGFKRATPGYMQDAIARATPNVDMRAYLGSLTAGEAKNARDTSPTGARGPFQFVPGTARQYGLTNPENLDASARAALKLTQDNAAEFERINGRPPTMAELAVMHQQGGTTGARMVAGTGNASPRNLSLNNVPAGAGPTEAVNRIKNYYGLPDRPVDTRDAVAAQIMARDDTAEAVPPVNPTRVPPGGDQRLAFNETPTTAIRPAPPAAPIQRAPVAAQPGYVLEVPPEPKPPGRVPMHPVEQRILDKIQNTPPAYRDTVREALQPMLQQAQDLRARQQQEADAIYKDKMTQRHELIKLQEQQKADQAKRIVDVEKEREAITEARQKNTLRAQFGNMPPDEIFKHLTDSTKVASSAAKSLAASQAAMAAFNAPGGVITGSGANQKLDIAKFFTAMGLVDKGDLIANTETFRNAMQPVVASIMHQTSGTSQLSEGELRFAQRAAAGDITLDPQSIRQLMTIIDKGSRGVIDSHQKKVDVLFGDNPQAKAVYGVEAPKPPAAAAAGVVDVASEAEAAKLPPGTKVRINGRIGTVQ